MAGALLDRDKRNNDVLHGMRGLAVLIVFMSHTSGRDMALAPWLQFHGIGHVGVYLFFVLTAYLLTRGLIEGTTTEQFYIRRFFRIAPLYYVVLLGVLVYQALGNFNPLYLHIKEGDTGALLHFLFLRGDSLFWTVPTEVAFYLILPLIVYGIARFGLHWVVAAAALYFIWFLLAMRGVLPAPKFVQIGHRGQFIDVFLCGVIAAYVTHELPKRAVAVLFWALLAATIILVSWNVFGAGRPWYGLRWLSLLYGAVFAAGIVSAVQGNRWIAAPLESRVMIFMGKCAFGWYLLHFPVFQIVNAIGPTSPQGRLVLATAGVSLAAWLAYEYIEKPGIRFGRELRGRRKVPA